METDFLVIGSGVAGLTFALDTRNYGRVAIITKKESNETNTNYAQGGIAAAIAPSDSIESHIQDTLLTGEGLCNPDAVKLMATEAPQVIEELSKLGVGFTKSRGAKFDLGREGGHSARRIVHTKDATGEAIETTLIKRAQERGVDLFENWLAVDLILEDDRCIGVWVFDTDENKILPFFAKSILIATGGIGSIYLHTTNPRIATGDGIAMAYRVGTPIANMEFVQFHPTSFYGKKIDGRALLLSEAVRGEGGVLKTKDGNAFMEKYDSRKELAPRDIVARAIHSKLRKRSDNYVLLDITGLGSRKILDKFPNIYNACLNFSIDPIKEPIPVVPAAHYTCGGIVVDIDGKTNIPGLYATGESACTGVHGANRLASNSLLESIIFAHRAAKTAIGDSKIRISKIERLEKNLQSSNLKSFNLLEKESCEERVISDYLLKIRKLMWEQVGIVRNDKELQEAENKILKYKSDIEKIYETHKISFQLIELRNAVTTASLVIECALKRKESRGLHFNLDHPEKDELHYKRDTILKKLDKRIKINYY
ncbi:L-aspartate oxidase [candidate division WOR-3 bacterium]|nr:L-aspartate oxidase [candidate division WOR-3 bacterium]